MVVAVALADQAARTLLLALVLLAVRPAVAPGSAGRSEVAVVGIFVAARALIGVVVVGFTRSAFVPVCFPEALRADHGRAAGITQLVFDATILSVSIVRALGACRAAAPTNTTTANPVATATGRDGGLVAAVVAALSWALAEFPFQLRVGSIFVRLAPPLLALVLLLCGSSSSFSSPSSSSPSSSSFSSSSSSFSSSS